MDCALLMTIVNKGMARKVVKASKEAGAEGGTTIMGRGTASKRLHRFLGISMEPEKEIIFTVIQKKDMQQVLDAVVAAGCMDKPGKGVSFVLNVKQVAGICHLCVLSTPSNVGGEPVENAILYDLIVSIVNKDNAELVVDASKEAGAEGGTILFGRGTGIHEQAKLFGISIEPEKEIVLTLINREQTSDVLQGIIKKAKLDQPGKGIAFVLEVQQVAGINHILNKMVSEKMSDSKVKS
ncbi:PII family protein [Dethiobacter alkaliphilus AHT 1]|uniref:PII family protein n=2 Tax=Dethiobacter TaxID=427925 RepID=C0GJL3_DETAL|nr:PII family protein [Dethiobacter alkaliphilus AHT 1]